MQLPFFATARYDSQCDDRSRIAPAKRMFNHRGSGLTKAI